MDAFDPHAMKEEIRQVASLSFADKELRVRAHRMEPHLRELHAEELHDVLLVQSVYMMYRNLFYQEGIQKIPDEYSRVSYGIAMIFFAR